MDTVSGLHSWQRSGQEGIPPYSMRDMCLVACEAT
ncbi:hypothetical protein HaLaN_14513, partial [Haematococcus lacustris]